MVRAILFDAADVLYRRPEPTRLFVAGLLRRMGLTGELSAEDRLRQKALKSEGSRGLISPDEYWDQVLQMYGVADPTERLSMVAAIDRHADDVCPVPGVWDLLAGLRQRGFVLCIVTNTMHSLERKMQWLQKVGVAPWIDFVACSTVVGAHKPEAAIYLDALRQAGLSPVEAAFVGHDAVELDGAQQVGLTTVAVHYQPGTRADYTANSLVELLNVPIFKGADEQGVKE